MLVYTRIHSDLFAAINFSIFDVYFSWPSEYPIVSIEDPFDREDWEHIKQFSELGLCQVCSLYLGLSFVYISTRSCK